MGLTRWMYTALVVLAVAALASSAMGQVESRHRQLARKMAERAKAAEAKEAEASVPSAEVEPGARVEIMLQSARRCARRCCIATAAGRSWTWVMT